MAKGLIEVGDKVELVMSTGQTMSGTILQIATSNTTGMPAWAQVRGVKSGDRFLVMWDHVAVVKVHRDSDNG